jgi:hypothetical protein
MPLHCNIFARSTYYPSPHSLGATKMTEDPIAAVHLELDRERFAFGEQRFVLEKQRFTVEQDTARVVRRFWHWIPAASR